MDKRLAFRLLMVPVLLFAFYSMGLPLEAVLIVGALYLFLILLRGKMWRAADKAIEKYLPFTRSWPDWTQKVLLFAFFLVFYLILKQVIYFALGLMGIDLTAMIMSSVETGTN